MKLRTIVLMITLILVTGAVPGLSNAQDAGDAKASANTTAEVAPRPNKRVCRKVKPTGSHIPQKVCMKQKEWDKMRREAQERMSKSGQHSTSSGS